MTPARLAQRSPACRRALVAALTQDGYVGPDSWLVGGMARRGLVDADESYDRYGEPTSTNRFYLTENGWAEARALAVAGSAP